MILSQLVLASKVLSGEEGFPSLHACGRLHLNFCRFCGPVLAPRETVREARELEKLARQTHILVAAAARRNGE